MSLFLGIDTSNYTTSAAVYDDGDGTVTMRRQLLRVRPGEKGLRQSDAVFAHLKNLPAVTQELFEAKSFGRLSAVGASARPRDLEGSYMPCFEAGCAAARVTSAAGGIPFYDFSHQAGHIAAALFSIDALELLKRRFIAFHVSGGTTEAVLCTPAADFPGNSLSAKIAPKTEIIARSLDLKAGQAIDRIGVMLGLPFPAGPELEKLALLSGREYDTKPCLKGGDCCLSGVENLCAAKIAAGEEKSDVARFCIDFIMNTLDGMVRAVLGRYPGVPLLFAGGVMSNSIIKARFTQRYGALFAKAEYSSDNAAGIAVLTGLGFRTEFC